MLNNFHLVAIVLKRTRRQLRQIPMSRDVQDKLAEKWQFQYDKFVQEIEEIPFDPSYKPDDHERFCEHNYKLPEWLEKENSLTASGLDRIRNNQAEMGNIKGIVAFARNEHNQELMLFQNFKRFQIIETDSVLSLFLRDDTYTNIETPGFTLGKKLSAIYHSTGRKLLFHSFRNVNIFLDLSEYFKEASEEDIREILSHELFYPENLDISVTNPSQTFRNKFALLKRSGVLDKITASEIEDRSKGFDVPIQLSEENKKIVFPSKKSDALKLLRFLNDEYVHGAATRSPYIANSKRKMD